MRNYKGVCPSRARFLDGLCCLTNSPKSTPIPTRISSINAKHIWRRRAIHPRTKQSTPNRSQFHHGSNLQPPKKIGAAARSTSNQVRSTPNRPQFHHGSPPKRLGPMGTHSDEPQIKSDSWDSLSWDACHRGTRPNSDYLRGTHAYPAACHTY